MGEAKDPKLALFELYLGTAEKISDRRAQANIWMLSVNSAIVSLHGYLQADKSPIVGGQKPLLLWAIPIAGVIVSFAWGSLLTSYRKLNHAKFYVLKTIEADLSVNLFGKEQEAYKSDCRISLAFIESWIPWCFVALYLVIAIANFIR